MESRKRREKKPKPNFKRIEEQLKSLSKFRQATKSLFNLNNNCNGVFLCGTVFYHLLESLLSEGMRDGIILNAYLRCAMCIFATH